MANRSQGGSSPHKERLYKAHSIICDRNKANRKIKEELNKEKWSKNKEYQEQQRIRLEELKAKGGYEKNIAKGKTDKIDARQARTRKYLARKREARTR